MEAPKCKFCGKVEWRHICGGLAERVKGKISQKPKTGPVVGPVVSRGTVGKFDRVSYQREYVKVWRAVKAGRADWWPRVSH